jgi:hypothetical protein
MTLSMLGLIQHLTSLLNSNHSSLHERDKLFFVMLKKFNRKLNNKNFEAEIFLNKIKINIQLINYQI